MICGERMLEANVFSCAKRAGGLHDHDHPQSFLDALQRRQATLLWNHPGKSQHEPGSRGLSIVWATERKSLEGDLCSRGRDAGYVRQRAEPRQEPTSWLRGDKWIGLHAHQFKRADH
jgi:hypothetical protein